MSKLTLQYEGIVLKEYALGTGVTIGRLPDNAVVIDNPAVSGHHARVYLEGHQVVLEDLGSTNGTFVNDRPIARHFLQHGDEVLVGKHQLVFDRSAVEAAPVNATPMEGLGDTVYLDTKQHRALRATAIRFAMYARMSLTVIDDARARVRRKAEIGLYQRSQRVGDLSRRGATADHAQLGLCGFGELRDRFARREHRKSQGQRDALSECRPEPNHAFYATIIARVWARS